MCDLKTHRLSNLILLSIALCCAHCVKPFTPPASTADNSYLVVDGTILGGADTTRIKLSRTKNLGDTAATVPELNASVLVEGENGNTTTLAGSDDGTYKALASVEVGQKYRLKILTSNGKEYNSDYIELKKTPDIDSLHWEQDGAVFIYLYTHDPANATKYYRWDFTETIEYHADYDSYLDFRDDQIVFLEPEEYRKVCYQSFPSDKILLGTSSALSSDIISKEPITSVPNDGTKMSVRYSILVRQFAIDANAYQYWKLLNQNNDETGGLFDPQPSQLISNIHCLQNSEEPVIGYLSASTITVKRLFIKENELKDRFPIGTSYCPEEPLSELDTAGIKLAALLGKLPAYADSSNPLVVEVVPARCVDCRLRGGSTQKPSFW